MAKKYGTTWWGQQWLHSHTLIDYNNRLPRGKTLASTGKVRSLDIKGNQINARVQGAQTVVERVGISVPLFTEIEKEKFIGALAKEAAFIPRLIKLDLPNELRQIAEKQGIRLFPESWKDFSMHCSCDDFSTPCEHLAALIYEIAEDIDKNQVRRESWSVGFSLRGAANSNAEILHQLRDPSQADGSVRAAIFRPAGARCASPRPRPLPGFRSRPASD